MFKCSSTRVSGGQQVCSGKGVGKVYVLAIFVMHFVVMFLRPQHHSCLGAHARWTQVASGGFVLSSGFCRC